MFILGDYIACCDEEEELLRSVYLQKRSESAIPEHYFVHFDIPLTLEHESGLLQNSGFIIEKVLDGSDGATIITARKVERIDAFSSAENPASEKVMENVGMHYEGLLRHYYKTRDGFHDCTLYGIIQNEWEQTY